MSNANTDRTATVAALRQLALFDEIVVGGAVWTRFETDFKVSPHGAAGDYDRGAYWVPACDISAELGA
jgi:hypothetical protein